MQQTKKTILFLTTLFLLILCGSVMASEAPFPGLFAYLQKQYGRPYQVLGKVKEVSEDKLLFERENISLYRGQELWVFDHKPGISPQLQKHIAVIRVEAVFPETVLARVVKVVERQIQAKDIVLTPPAPSVYLYTNIKAKHTFEPYQALLKSLLDSGFEVKEVSGASLAAAPAPEDLVLRVEVEAGHLICQIHKGLEGPLLYTESKPLTKKVETQFPPGQRLMVMPVPPPGVVSAAPPPSPPGPLIPQRVETGTPPPVTGSSFQKAALPTKNEFYRLPRTFSRVVNCDLDGDGIRELACLGEHALFIYHLSGNRLIEVTERSFARDSIPLHLHVMDLNGDGTDELLVTMVELVTVMDKQDHRLVSQILTYKRNKLAPIKTDMPFYLRVIRDRAGKAVALAQKRGGYEQYSGPIYELKWNASSQSLDIAQPYLPARNVYSIYQFNLVPNDPNRILILEVGNDLHGYYAPEERMEVSAGRNYGRFEEIGYPIKLEKDQYTIGGFDKVTSREVFAPRRFELRPEFDGQSFLIYKERLGGWIRRTAKKIFGSKEGMDQVVGVKWSGDRIIETWQSKRLAKDIIDFTFFHNPDRMMILYRDSDGYALEAFY